MSARSWWRAVGVGLIVAACARPALAQDVAALSAQDQGQRRVWIDRAMLARDGGRHAEALAFAERAGALRMTPSLRRFLAEEQASLGQLVLALATATACIADEARSPGALNREEDLRACRAMADDLSARLGRVVVRVQTPGALRVRVDGVEVDRARWNAPVAVNPGEVVVEARGPGVEPFSRSVRVVAGATVEVLVTPVAERSALSPAVPWVVLGASAAVLTGAVVANVMAEQRVAVFNTRDANHACQVDARRGVVGTASCAEEHSAATAARAWAAAGYAVAGALVAADVVLFVVAASHRGREPAPRAAGVACVPVLGETGVTCTGVF